MPAWLIPLLGSLGRGIVWLFGQLSLGLFLYERNKTKQAEKQIEEAKDSAKDANAISQLSDNDLDDILRDGNS